LISRELLVSFFCQKRAALIAIELDEPPRELVPCEAPGEQIPLRPPHPHDLDMRHRYAVGELATLGSSPLARNRARGGHDDVRKLRIKPHRSRQAMAESVADGVADERLVTLAAPPNSIGPRRQNRATPRGQLWISQALAHRDAKFPSSISM